MRDPRSRGKRGKRRFVVHNEPGGPVVVEEPTAQPQSVEEVVQFFAGLDDRLKALQELDKGGGGSR